MVYNLVLAVVVLVCFAVRYPGSKIVLSVDFGLVLFLLVVLANVAYCAAYLVDIFAQVSGFREQWRRYRWVLFVIGLVFAGIITRFIALGVFSSGAAGNG